MGDENVNGVFKLHVKYVQSHMFRFQIMKFRSVMVACIRDILFDDLKTVNRVKMVLSLEFDLIRGTGS